MNAVPMVRHSGFHQRTISREPVCPTCGYTAQFLMDPANDYIGYWTCSNRCRYIVPVWRDLERNDCPHPELHTPTTL